MKSEKSGDHSLVDLIKWQSVKNMSDSIDRLSRAIYVISVVFGAMLVIEILLLISRTVGPVTL